MSEIQTVEEKVTGLKLTLTKNYQKAIENYFGDPKKALKFLSGVVAAVQQNPALLECSPVSVINSFMTMAQLELMPSNVSGEAYVLPYNNKNGKVAQFQLGYQGLVTLFYRAGAKAIYSEIVRENDKFSYINGQITHEPDVFGDRGKAKGAYVIVTIESGQNICKVMSEKEILLIGSKFSKSYATSNSPWNVNNDPELWMWKKTVLKQAAKLIPKNERIFEAIAADNQDSNIEEKKERFGGLELPTPARVAEKKAAKEAEQDLPAHTQTIPEGEQENAHTHSMDTEEVTYETTDDSFLCTKCTNAMTSSEVDACDIAGEPHICSNCKLGKPKTTANTILNKRKKLEA